MVIHVYRYHMKMYPQKRGKGKLRSSPEIDTYNYNLSLSCEILFNDNQMQYLRNFIPVNLYFLFQRATWLLFIMCVEKKKKTNNIRL